MKVRSMRGEWLDVGVYLAQNEEQIALGNANLNARGDVIDKKGNIVERKEDIASKYYARNPKAVKQVGIKNLDAEVFQTPAQVMKAAREAAAAQSEQAVKKGRKITDSDQ